MNKKTIQQQLPIMLTILTCLILCIGLYWLVILLNYITNDCAENSQCISTDIHIRDILIGSTIYLKTSVDFAIFIGNIMRHYRGVKGRIAIEIGTAFGNALGTVVVLVIWNFFKEIKPLLAIMIFFAALVLVKLAEEGFEHAREFTSRRQKHLKAAITKLEDATKKFNGISHHVLKFIIPNLSLQPKKGLSFLGLINFSFTVPFILGLDDFAGYVPLFNVVNVLGFSMGVVIGHMVLNLLLFLSPEKTIKIVKNPLISLLGSIVFILLAVWGIIEVYKILFLH